MAKKRKGTCFIKGERDIKIFFQKSGPEEEEKVGTRNHRTFVDLKIFYIPEQTYIQFPSSSKRHFHLA